MAEEIRIWYDPEGDYLEIILHSEPGYYEETGLDQVMKKVDLEGRVLHSQGELPERRPS